MTMKTQAAARIPKEQTDAFQKDKEIEQGDTLSTNLFNITLDQAIEANME